MRDQVRIDEAPAGWFNTCGEGRRKRCVKTQFLGRVDLPDQCVSHAKVRRQLEAT